MKSLWKDIPFIGKLYIVDVYVYYDEPLLFFAVDEISSNYLVNAIDDDKWLMVRVSKERLEEIVSNRISLRDVYEKPEIDNIIVVTDVNNNIKLENLKSSDLTDDMLPDPGIGLTEDIILSEDKNVMFNDGTLVNEHAGIEETAEIEKRVVVDISFRYKDTHKKEIPAAELGSILCRLQNLYQALPLDRKHLGRIPNEQYRNNTLCVVGTFAASFGVRFKSVDLVDLFGNNELLKTTDLFYSLLNAGDSDVCLEEYLKDRNPLVGNRYLAFLNAMSGADVGVNIDIASPGYKKNSLYVSANAVKDKLKIASKEIDISNKTINSKGKLVGIDKVNNKFTFITDEDEEIKGKLSRGVRDRVFVVPSDIDAEIKVICRSKITDVVERLDYELINFSVIN